VRFRFEGSAHGRGGCSRWLHQVNAVVTERSWSDSLPRSAAEAPREGRKSDEEAMGASTMEREFAAAVDRETAGADETRDRGTNASRTGDGSRPAKECKRMRADAGGGVGRSALREGGVGDGDWEYEFGLSGEGVRGEDERSEELLGGALARDDGGDAAAVVSAKLEEDERGD